jgi:hypothetical protein
MVAQFNIMNAERPLVSFPAANALSPKSPFQFESAWPESCVSLKK